MSGLFKKRSNTSLFDRKFYSDRLAMVLINPPLKDIKKAYLLTYTEANEKNLKDILKYIKTKRYFCLSRIRNRMPYFEDAFGETIGTNIYELYLIIDGQRKYYLLILYVQFIGEYKEYMVAIEEVKPFWQLTFFPRRLIYPI